jgi:hypothetical protein
LKDQGIAPPTARGEAFVDPGARYHVPDNTPHTRHFLADILDMTAVIGPPPRVEQHCP